MLFSQDCSRTRDAHQHPVYRVTSNTVSERYSGGCDDRALYVTKCAAV
ncbi:hypothetical protein E2C01_003959 [Portunus trituberculatus]|uniref:Uncharacterized protein n=1 Tax=Portunus trituberculatus TaxID=210409 RepID=A0A5B7CNL5_PORTR|nr:hypothetical protein [Portunus trituberculatus]